MKVKEFFKKVTHRIDFNDFITGVHKIGFITEDEDNYYIMEDHGSDSPYHTLMWAYDKKTGKSYAIDLIHDYLFEIKPQTKEVKPPYDNLRIGSR